MLNACLKSFFEVYQPPTASVQGFAFPSGHTGFCIVLWGWLAWEWKNKVFAGFVLTLWAGMFWAIVHKRYHLPADIIGGISFGFLCLVGYYSLLKINILRVKHWLIGISLLVFTVPLFYITQDTLMRSYLISNQTSILLLSLSWWISSKYREPQKLAAKAWIGLLGSIGVGLQYYMWSTLELPTLSKLYKNCLQYGLLIIWVAAFCPLIWAKVSRHSSSKV